MQMEEGEDTILVAIVDQTYGVSDDEAWEAEREAFRLELEAEFDMSFDEGNIGPGADFPVFVALLDMAVHQVWPFVIAALLLGKPIRENLAAWRDMARKLQSFFTRGVYFNRKGALVLAVDAVFDELGNLPKSIRLLGYRPSHVAESEDLATMVIASEAADALPTLNLGVVIHVFELDVDGAIYRVQIDGKKTAVLRVGGATANEDARC
jgi:hypothetical protein